jgi:hypothetical protein
MQWITDILNESRGGLCVRHLLKGRHRLDLVPGDQETNVADFNPMYYYKYIGETESPMVFNGELYKMRGYVWRPLEEGEVP